MNVVVSGRNQMPAFGSALSLQDREDLAAYVLQLAAGNAPARPWQDTLAGPANWRNINANWLETLMSRYQVRELLPPPYARNPPSTIGDWLGVVRKGIPGPGVAGLLEAVGLTRTEFCAALNIPERTLARRMAQGRLTPDESEKVLRLGRVWERATTVLASDAAARDWLKSPNGALENAAPLSLLDADIGADAVLDLLGRIEHGIFS